MASTPPEAGVLPILYNVQPNRGSPRGGQTVTLTGRYFTRNPRPDPE
ncbi:MAG: IPT/TIG domain-containing protein [Gammaproteobacteria bacterium]|nr:IPT/TIG domain-containing protein [Gammaproteobacteria bacterium]